MQSETGKEGKRSEATIMLQFRNAILQEFWREEWLCFHNRLVMEILTSIIQYQLLEPLETNLLKTFKS